MSGIIAAMKPGVMFRAISNEEHVVSKSQVCELGGVGVTQLDAKAFAGPHWLELSEYMFEK